ncbi:putative hydrolase [compost metagenome]
MNLLELENILEKKISTIASSEDPAHDLLHFKRVVKVAKEICKAEGGKMEVVLPAAWLHDFVIVPKSDPRRKQASRLSAEGAVDFLRSLHYPENLLEEIAHAIEAHSFSANIPARTLEAKIVQDADRLDGVGAIGVARCFATAALMKRAFYSEQDPFCEARTPDDIHGTVDHFYTKLFKTVEMLQTAAGRAEGKKRTEFMRLYLETLKQEIN